MRLLVNHPHLVNPSISKSYQKSGKMIALHEILCSMGWEDEACSGKLVIFSQYNSTLSLIEESLLHTVRFRDIQYLRLTSDLTGEERFRNAERFNNSLECRVLLVSSKVGSLGLNLCKASVVVMFDHSYNPCEDQQAMDRAHRIGQKKVLVVYRLIAKGTLEEKLMNYQRFKTLIANSVINLDNASITTLEDADSIFAAVKDVLKETKDKPKEYGQYSKIIGEAEHEMLDMEAFNNPFATDF
jgi:TATA-binding protein-associated factor